MLTFSTLTASDANIIEEFVRDFEPYSDFNFVSLLSWALDSQTTFCLTEDCLFLALPDYLTQKTSYSFMSKNPIKALSLFNEWLERQQRPAFFSLIPESVAKALDKTAPDSLSYLLTEDRNNFDYIIDCSDFAALKGKGYADIRYKLSYFRRTYLDEITTLEFNPNNTAHTQLALSLAQKWAANKSPDDTQDELEALSRFLELAKDKENLFFKAYLHQGYLVAFASYELVGKEYALGHFLKYNPAYKGAYYQLVYEVCKDVNNIHNRKWLNIEQDLGIKGLRDTKLHLKPCGFLKKYNLVLS